MKKVLKCECGNYMVYDGESFGGFSFTCSCGNSCLVTKDNHKIKLVEDDKITEATNEQKYKSALQFIYDITDDYDGCNTIEGLKGLIDEVNKRVKDVL